MPFDLERFRQQQFEHRTEAVKLPGLKAWFGGDEPVWVVRGMTAGEIHQISNSMNARSKVDMLVKALVVKDTPEAERIKQMREAVGLPSSEVPDETKRRMEMLVIATVSPEGLTLADAVKFAEAYPIEFIEVTNKINALTGRGQVEQGESKPSGKTSSSEEL